MCDDNNCNRILKYTVGILIVVVVLLFVLLCFVFVRRRHSLRFPCNYIVQVVTLTITLLLTITSYKRVLGVSNTPHRKHDLSYLERRSFFFLSPFLSFPSEFLSYELLHSKVQVKGTVGWLFFLRFCRKLNYTRTLVCNCTLEICVTNRNTQAELTITGKLKAKLSFHPHPY